jgi:CSLREA domain-containing protein
MWARKVSSTAVICVTLALAASPAAAAATITVTTTADVVANDGKCSLREAITAADAKTPSGAAAGECPAGTGHDKIELIGGTYELTKGHLNISSGVTLDGSGVAATTISANGADRAIDVLAGGQLTVSALTLTGGHAPDGANAAPGPTPPTVGAGGGAIDSAGTLTLRDAALVGNVSGAGGSDPSNPGGAGAGGGNGGALLSTGPALTLIDTTISGNRAGSGGSGQAAGGLGGAGGGIYSTSPVVTISGSTISGNHAGDGGPGGFVHGSGNSGGGLELINAGVAATTITNTTIVSNATGSDGSGGGPHPGSNGGALELRGTSAVGGGTATLGNVTIARNTTLLGSAGGGDVQSFGALTVANSVIDGSCAGSITDGGHNLSTRGGCPGVGVDPQLGPLRDNGGATSTMLPAAGSPLIDAVPAIGAGCPSTDQRGVPRPQGRACDAGAVELRPTVLRFGPSPLRFRPTRVGHRSAPLMATLTYVNGETQLAIGRASVSGAAAREFRIAGDGCASARLLPSGSCRLTIRFQPRREGKRSAQLTVDVPSPAGAQRLLLVGAGTNGYTLKLTPRRSAGRPGRRVALRVLVLDGGAPLRGVSVLFSVTGANHARYSSASDRGGSVRFLYLGVHAGLDVVTACLDLNRNHRCDATEPRAGAERRWFARRRGHPTRR